MAQLAAQFPVGSGEDRQHKQEGAQDLAPEGLVRLVKGRVNCVRGGRTGNFPEFSFGLCLQAAQTATNRKDASTEYLAPKRPDF